MKNKTYLLNIVAIMSLFILGGCGTYENPAVQTMIEAWPNIPTSTIRMIITLPSLTSTIAMVIAGQIVGKKLTYRTCIITGGILALVSGLLPFFIHPSWYFILGTRIFLGLGVGMMSIKSSLLILSVHKDELAKMIGYSSVFGSICSALISPVVGKICSLGWHYSFLANGLVLVSLILVILFVKEPEYHQETKHIESKGALPSIMSLFFVVQFIATLVLYPLLSGISSYFAELQIGSATVAGFMLSIYTASGALSNFFLDRLQKRFKRNLLTIFLLMPFIGGLLVLYTRNIVLIGIGVFLSGMGFITMSSSLQVYAGLFCDEGSVPKASTLLMACTQAGVFLSSYYIDVTVGFHFYDVEMMNPYFICIITYAILAIISFILRNKTYPSISND